MFPLLVLVATALFSLAVYELSSLVRYVRQARATDLPYVVTPFLETETVALLATPLLRWIYSDYLDRGTGWPRWCRFIIKDWSWEDKRRAHDEYGDVFLCVSPQGIICYSADAAMGWDVMNRRNDFTKPPDKYKLLELYGPNVATAEGATYRFHVRVTAPPFGDLNNVNELVWNETIHQTHRLLDVWSKQSSRELHMDVNSVTLAVISLAGFGKRVDWTNGVDEEQIPPGYKYSFLKAISDTTTHMVAILLFPGWLLNLSPLRKAHTAHLELDKYLREIIRDEQSRLERDSSYENSEARANLLTSVIRASKTEGQINSKKTGSSRKDMLTEDEVMGNLFIYLLAGYETTANAIVYGLIALALHPEIQRKVAEEINARSACAVAEGRSGLSYTEDFEQLTYTYAFMYESFRMYPGVILITKMASKQQPIHVSGEGPSSTPATHQIPPGTRVYLSSPGVQFNPRHWPDPYTFDPDRWLSPCSNNTNMNNSLETSEKRVVAADRTRQMRGTLLTFSDGARACLGRKFAQAEYVAFLTALLKDFCVTLAPHEDPKRVERDLFLKCAGKVTLSPHRNVGLTLQRRR
ncbi:MAG: hypothetical protein Q9226_005871 [Calogaya cf. arnoldii]